MAQFDHCRFNNVILTRCDQIEANGSTKGRSRSPFPSGFVLMFASFLSVS
ncbi:hypothetical protein GCWU000246_01835 [Jonquetella anthropi E3_33 E1]|nr:hypothetical protein GCWU000246_01835 [Jonquetella anthropi E3_33 E1]